MDRSIFFTPARNTIIAPPIPQKDIKTPKGAVESSLSQILLDTVPSKYYLSRKACLGILRRAKERGKPLPPQLEQALKLQAGAADNSALTAMANMQTFLTQKGHIYAAAFSANAGSRAGSTGYQEEVSPTLKGAQSGGMMPAVLCLNDQGGGVMDCSEDVIGTLRAQEHRHQPAVLFENHGIDGRYTGPHTLSPTLSARAGTGGNNLPLAFQQDHSTPAAQLIRRLVPQECELLQGFPPGWTDLPGASDSARYKALGNSVAVPCVEYLMQGIALVLRAGR